MADYETVQSTKAECVATGHYIKSSDLQSQYAAFNDRQSKSLKVSPEKALQQIEQRYGLTRTRDGAAALGTARNVYISGIKHRDSA